MNDQQLLRYSRQILLPHIDYAGQQRLLASHVLIVGLGGLGSPVALYLAAAGVGHLILNDHDVVELSNLQRQIIHQQDNIGVSKVVSAKKTIQQLNNDPHITLLCEKLSTQHLAQWVKNADIVVDASDNFSTRFRLNALCVQNNTPLVSGAAIRMEGQISSYANTLDSPCYRCLYSDNLSKEDNNCSNNGILASVVGMIGTMQATEVLKILLGIGKPLYGRLLLLDALNMEWRMIKVKKDPACPVCYHPDIAK